GKSQAQHLVRALSGFTVRPATESGDKLTRFGPFSSHSRAGNVEIQRGSWNEDLFRVLEGFRELAHDDEVDACSGALEMLNPQMKGSGFFEFARRQAEKLQAERETASGRSEPTWGAGSIERQAEQENLNAEQEKLKGGGSSGLASPATREGSPHAAGAELTSRRPALLREWLGFRQDWPALALLLRCRVTTPGGQAHGRSCVRAGNP